MAAPGTLANRGFLALNGILFLAATVMALFFQFHLYLSGMGIDTKWTGLIIGADSLAVMIIQPLLSPFLHNGNARRWIVAGTAGIILALLLYGTAREAVALTALRLLQGIGLVCLLTGFTVLVINFVPGERSGQAFGIMSVTRLLPYALIPPLLTSFAGGADDFLRVLKMGALLMCLAFPAVLLVKPPAAARIYGSTPPAGLRHLVTALGSRGIPSLLLINLLLYTGYTAVFFYLRGYASTLGEVDAGFFFTVATCMMIVVRLGGSRLFDRMNKVGLTAGSLLLLAVSSMGMVYVSGPLPFYGLALLFGIGWGVSMPILMALVFDLSAPDQRALNLNLTMVVLQGGFFLGPLAGNYFLNFMGYSGLFLFCAAVCLVAAFLTRQLSPAGDTTSPKEVQT